MFKLKHPVIRTAAASAGVAGSHLLTVHVSRSNWPAGYGGGVKSVQLAVVPSSKSAPYPVAGDSETFTIPGTAQLYTIAGGITCGRSWWNSPAPSVPSTNLTKWVQLSSTQRDMYV
ncbi:hypothetical protein ACQCSX_02190 [Pseudarthrobacter sp. P1]|uniref:hypothetical protein n=1 Tax=Pseudarthrobacter sp. P1 TaxID=3418418 RepID=UPI003CED18E6